MSSIYSLIGIGPDGRPKIQRLDEEGNSILTFDADVQQGQSASIQVTLNITPNTITGVDVPLWANGVRIRPTGAALRFAINENPALIATSNVALILTSALSVGSIAYADETETRIIGGNGARQLRLMSTVASTVVVVEFF